MARDRVHLLQMAERLDGEIKHVIGEVPAGAYCGSAFQSPSAI